MDDFLSNLQQFQTARANERERLFWVGHSLIQLPFRILEYTGRSEVMVLTYLYERASSISFYSKSEVFLEIHVSQQTIAKRTGLSENAVSSAVVELEADNAIRVERRRDPVTKQIRLSVYVLLHSQNESPLTSTPGVFGVCRQNLDLPYISAPKETRSQLSQMTPGGRAVYLSALALASKRIETRFGLLRDEWKSASRLGKNAFWRGLRECEKRGLLSYQKQVLTLNDPGTGAPSRKQAHDRVVHQNPKWKFDLNSVTPEQWERVVTDLLHHEFIIGSDGWSRTQRGVLCPFCKADRSFAVNFLTCQYLCHQKCGERSHGRLGQLVQRVLRVNMGAAKEYIKQRLPEPARAA